LPEIVRRRTWSGASARKRIVASPRAIRERSAYSRPETEIAPPAKFSVPTTRILPSVEILIVTCPLKDSSEA
jgi:hypothetical protein